MCHITGRVGFSVYSMAGAQYEDTSALLITKMGSCSVSGLVSKLHCLDSKIHANMGSKGSVTQAAKAVKAGGRATILLAPKQPPKHRNTSIQGCTQATKHDAFGSWYYLLM